MSHLSATLRTILVFALLKFMAAAGDARRRRGSSETSLLSAALSEAVAKLKAQERATAARAETFTLASGETAAGAGRFAAGQGRGGRPLSPEPGP